MGLTVNAGRAAAKRKAVKRAGGGNGSAGLKTTRIDPTRTVMMRKALTAELRRRFARLKALVVKLVVDEDAFGADARRDPKYDTLNAFCPTGEGGGVDPSCTPGGAAGASKAAGIELDKVASHVVIEPATLKVEQELADLPHDAHVERGEAHARLAGMYRSQFSDKMYIVEGLVKAHVDAAEKHKKVAGVAAQIVKIPYRKPRMTFNAGRWRFESDREKVRLFAEWLKRQMGVIVAGKTARDILKRYALEGMKKGAGRAFDDVRKREKFLGMEDKEKLDFYNGTRDQFLRDSFRQPVSVQRVEALAGRSYDDLENITTDMSARMGRTLLDGLVQGKGAEDLATDLADQVDIGRTRAEVIARTEVIRAHAEGQLQAMEEMGVEEVGVAVEWVTAQDDKVCPKCEALEGVVLKISEARGMLPRHPQCRCAWLPAGLGEDTSDQIDTKRGITAALKGAGEDDGWGPDVSISRDRPEGIFNTELTLGELLGNTEDLL